MPIYACVFEAPPSLDDKRVGRHCNNARPSGRTSRARKRVRKARGCNRAKAADAPEEGDGSIAVVAVVDGKDEEEEVVVVVIGMMDYAML